MTADSRRRYLPRDEAESRAASVALYLRMSQDTGTRRGEVEGLGIARQEAACRAEVERRGWTVDDGNIYRDNDVSASSSKPRPGYSALMRRVESGEVDTVVSWSVDRLLRKPVEMEHLIELVDGTTRLRVVTCQGMLNLETPEGRAAARVQAAFARQEADQKGLRQHLSEQQAVERGRPPRRRAFGYAKGGMEIELAEGAAVADAYRMLIAGASLATIARRINDRGLTTTLGRPWEPTAVRTLLLNARNAAIRTYYGEEVGPGTWPAIVTEDVYRQAVALLRDPARTTSGGSTARKHLGASLYRCGVCEAEGIDSTVRTAYRQAGARIYVCTRTRHLARLAGPIDELVIAVIEGRLRRPDVADVLATEDPELADLHEQAAAVRARIRRIEADYGDGEITARIMREQIDRQSADLAGIERRVAALTRSSRLAAVAGAADPVTAWRDLDVPARQAVVDVLCTVTLLPASAGRRPFDPSTVRIEGKGGASKL
ncbi:recombinase family protein [Modestobacter sp. DSM 44400]|uniref:recombinase family protein n=1 Tax=Modestobacter sp. DSM 44400 TaxID=1550230 RepID=UPI0011150AA7|nr:recombinase family protein [Modestobacter sp. DSM 44400]